MDRNSAEPHLTAIRHATWMVRYYGARQSRNIRRTQAILHLALVVREAFNNCDDYEAILGTLVDGLRPKDDPPF